MYNINILNDFDLEPWKISLGIRCKEFEQAIANNKKVSLMIYERADTSTFRYRCYNLYQWTQKSEQWQCIYFFLDEISTILKYLDKCAIVVIVRVRWEHCIDQIIYRAKQLGKKVIFDVDDLIFDINYLNLVTNTLNVHFAGERDYEFWFACISRIGFTASKADGFTCTNSFLGERLQNLYGKPYSIIPNSLNLEQIEISKRCVEAKEKQISQRPFTIGYFSGTPSHINDFKVVYRELAALLHDYPEMQLNVVGFMEFPEDLKTFIDAGRITFHPLVDFLELQRLMAEVDVNIVPLVNNTFTNCKSELKFFEGAIVNTITLATPIYTYANAIQNGVNGYLCNEGEWYEAIKNIFMNKENTDKLIKKAYQHAMINYSGNRFVNIIENAYNARME